MYGALVIYALVTVMYTFGCAFCHGLWPQFLVLCRSGAHPKPTHTSPTPCLIVVRMSKTIRQSAKDKPSGADVEVAILTWFGSANKPATVQSLVDALQSKYSKPSVQRTLEILFDRGDLQAKDFKKVRLYFPKGMTEGSPEPASLVDVEGLVGLRSEVDKLGRMHEALCVKLASLNALPSLVVLSDRHFSLRTCTDALLSRLESLRSTDHRIDVDPLAMAQLGMTRANQWRDRRRLASDLSEHIDCSSLGLEGDLTSLDSCLRVFQRVAVREG